MQGESNWADLVPEHLVLKAARCLLRGNLAFSLKSPSCYGSIMHFAWLSWGLEAYII